MKEFYIPDDGIRLHAKLDMPVSGELKESDKAKESDESIESNGSKIRCPLVIVVHGYTGHMEERHIVAVSKAINEIGMATLRVEMYGHGGSDGEFKNHTLYKWVGNMLAVVKYARTLDFVTNLYITGHSQGGLLTMLIGGMCRQDFKAILPLSPAWMIPEAARRGEILGEKVDPCNIPDEFTRGDRVLDGNYIRVAQTIHVEDEIDRYNGPVLIVHGSGDEMVPYEYGVKAQKLYQNAKLVTIPGDTHCYDYHLEMVCGAVQEFLKEMDAR